MRKIRCILLIMLVFLLYGCNKNVFATDITVTGLSDSYCVGDVINLDDINIVINPINVTFKPEISVSNQIVAEISSSEIKFIAAGECNIIFSVKSSSNTYVYYTKTVNIKNVTYASSLIFENDLVTVNFNDVANNKLTINPTNCDVTPQISYSNNNVVSYNYLSGTITPINVGSTTVTAKIAISKTETVEASFNCVVTNNIFASSMDATILDSNNVTLKTGYSGNIITNILPSNYNMGVSYSCSNNLITISNDGSFVVGNNAGFGKIYVKVKSVSGEITKTIDFTIVETISNLDVTLLYNNEPTTKFYVGLNYVAQINTLNIDYSKVTFLNCNYSYLGNNKFNIVFNNAGSTNFIAKYSYNLSSGVFDVVHPLNLMVYNTISDANFGLYYNDNEIISNNNEYNLSLIDTNYITDAAINNVYNSAKLVTTPKGTNICADDFNIEIIGDAVSYNNNILNANKVGSAFVKISSLDPLGFTKTYKINVTEVKATDINVLSNKISLDLADNSSCNLTYSVMPTYAYNKNVTITQSNNIISINNNVISALEIGECTVTLSLESVTKQILVKVLPIPNKLEVKIDNEVITNNFIKTLTINSSIQVNANLFYNDIKTNDVVGYSVKGNSVIATVSGVSNSFIITAKSLGESKVEFKFNNLLFIINFVVEDENEITQASFDEHNMDINLFLTNSITPKLLLTYKYPNKELTNRNISLVSTNNNVAIILGESINLISVGNATIKLLLNNSVVDTLELNVYNEEIIEINSAKDFSNLQNKHYLVTSNLDLTNFGTINTFAGVIDFNNHSVTGLSVPLFNTLESSSVIKNLRFSSDIKLIGNQLNNYSVIALNNNGLIDNVSFENLNVGVLGNDSIVFLSIICNNNAGVISNINFNNVTVNEIRENVTSSTSKFNGVTSNNSGEINGVNGTINISNFVKACGVCETTLNSINNIELELNIITCNKFVGAGLVYSIFSENVVEISNVNINLNLSGNVNINAFGGLARSINSSCNLKNVEVNLNFDVEYPNNKLALFCNSVSSDIAVTLTNCKHNIIDGYNAVISGELN